MIIINNCEERGHLLVISGEQLDLNKKFNLYLCYDGHTQEWKKDAATNPKITDKFCETIIDVAKQSPYNEIIKGMELRIVESYI
jgi:hypothetical protein